MTPRSRPTSVPRPWQNASSGGAEHHQAARKARSAASNTPGRASDASSEEQRGLTLYGEHLCHSGECKRGVCATAKPTHTRGSGTLPFRKNRQARYTQVHQAGSGCPHLHREGG